MAISSTAADAAGYLLTSHGAYFVVLVAFVTGLGGMVLSKNRKGFLALSAFIAWAGVYLAYPHDVALGFSDNALLNAAKLIFFLVPIMTTIEMGVHYGIMDAVLRLIQTTRMRTLVIIVGLMSFVLSAVLDNLTAAIVMAVLVTQLMSNVQNRIIFACLIVVSANAGGVPSAIGNTTSILLWVGGQLTFLEMFKQLVIPSLIYMAVIFSYFLLMVNGQVERPVPDELDAGALEQTRKLRLPPAEQWTILVFLLSCIGIVIFAKLVMHMDPWLGAMGTFGVFSMVTYFMNKFKGTLFVSKRGVRSSLNDVDWATVKMFMYMLPLVAAAGNVGILDDLAQVLIAGADTFGTALGPNARVWILAIVLGLISMIIPNTPLVAAAQEMFPLEVYGQNELFWVLLNFTSGTGGSLLLLGSGAGVVIASRFEGSLSQGVYIRTIMGPALLAYAAGIFMIYLQHVFF